MYKYVGNFTNEEKVKCRIRERSKLPVNFAVTWLKILKTSHSCQFSSEDEIVFKDLNSFQTSANKSWKLVLPRRKPKNSK
jgi:hypothetical protein